MSGIDNATKVIASSGKGYIDGIITTAAWADSTIYYAFPSSEEPYNYHVSYHNKVFHSYFAEVSEAQKAAVAFALDADVGSRASAGFSVEGFTNLDIEGKGDVFFNGDIEILIAQTSSPIAPFNTIATAMVMDLPSGQFTPGDDSDNGDVWFGTQVNLRNPAAGNFAWQTHIHEMGHALGLVHGHQFLGIGGGLPYEWDALEFSVMTYSSYIGADGLQYYNPVLNFAQTWMIADIAALQHMYGADYTTNSGDTVYKWNPNSGETLVNGVIGINAASNKIFAAIWDGGGTDTYDLSSYRSAVQIDLRDGKTSTFSKAQVAELGDGNFASGNIYNAFMHGNDKRSLIENATTGSGNDVLTGNQANNVLISNKGHDVLLGLNGSDQLYGKSGRDTLFGGNGDDYLKGGGGNDKLYGGKDEDTLFGGGRHDKLYGQKGNDGLYGGKGRDLLKGGAGNDQLYGNAGKDTLIGNKGDDNFFGGKGNDKLVGGAGRDNFFYTDGINEGNDRIANFHNGTHIITIVGGTFENYTITKVGNHTNIHNTDGTDILLLNIDAALIGAEDFAYI